MPLFLSPACSPKIFQKTKCSICNSALELPSVHFLCGHSFHQHCFESYSESDADCPTCLPENRKVMDMIRAQEQKRDLHDQFQHQVGMSRLKRLGERLGWSDSSVVKSTSCRLEDQSHIRRLTVACDSVPCYQMPPSGLCWCTHTDTQDLGHHQCHTVSLEYQRICFLFG